MSHKKTDRTLFSSEKPFSDDLFELYNNYFKLSRIFL